jgi:hypothetical protein
VFEYKTRSKHPIIVLWGNLAKNAGDAGRQNAPWVLGSLTHEAVMLERRRTFV